MKDRRALLNRQFARSSRTPARNAAVKFLLQYADVDLHMLVADAAGDVASELVATEFSRRVTVHEADLATGPNERRFFDGQRFSRCIIFSVFRIPDWSRN